MQRVGVEGVDAVSPRGEATGNKKVRCCKEWSTGTLASSATVTDSCWIGMDGAQPHSSVNQGTSTATREGAAGGKNEAHTIQHFLCRVMW